MEKWAVMFESVEGVEQKGDAIFPAWKDITLSFHEGVVDAYKEAYEYRINQIHNPTVRRIWIAPQDKRFDESYKYKPVFNLL